MAPAESDFFTVLAWALGISIVFALYFRFFKINERQYIELFPEAKPQTDRLNHISIQTDDAEALRKYLASRGIAVPRVVGKGRIGTAGMVTAHVVHPRGIEIAAP